MSGIAEGSEIFIAVSNPVSPKARATSLRRGSTAPKPCIVASSIGQTAPKPITPSAIALE